MDEKYLLFIGICMFNPCLQNVGMGIQKMAVDQTPKASTPAGKRKWIFVWIFGLLLQAVVVILGSVALTLGNAATLGGFAGLGLIFLALFAWFALKEKIVPKEMLGMILIVAGTIILGVFSHGSQSADVNMETQRIAGFFAVYGVLFIAGIVLLTRNLNAYGGAILGLLGGSMNGLGVVFQKVVVNRLVELSHSGLAVWLIIVKLLLNGYTWIMIVGGIGGLIVIQFGYKYGKAVQVVPGHASMVVVVPVMAGMIILGETMPVKCLAGIAVIIVGVLITTTAAPGKHAA